MVDLRARAGTDLIHLMPYDGRSLLVTLHIRFRTIHSWGVGLGREVHVEVVATIGAVGRSGFLRSGNGRRFRSVGYPCGGEL
jgi:hypothetical protein